MSLSTSYEPHDFVYIRVENLIKKYRPGSQGDDWSWYDEVLDLSSRGDKLRKLVEDVSSRGIHPDLDYPILLGNDGRIWDGHHRICAALLTGKQFIPVVLSSHNPFN